MSEALYLMPAVDYVSHNPLVLCSTHGRPTNKNKDLGEKSKSFFFSTVNRVPTAPEG